MHALIPSTTAADVARAFQSYRQTLALATTKAFDPSTTEAAAFLPPFWNYKAPNVWIEADGDLMNIIYKPQTSPYENSAIQDLDITVIVAQSLAALPETTPPVVFDPASTGIYPCVLCNNIQPWFMTGFVGLQISPDAATPPFPITYYVQATAGPVQCLIGDQELFGLQLQQSIMVVQITCDATSMTLPLDPNDVFTLTVTRGSILSLLYQTPLCPELAAIFADPNQQLPPPPLDDLPMLNTSTGPMLGQNTGPGSSIQMAKDMFQPQQTNNFVLGIIMVCAVVIISLGFIGVALYVVLADGVRYRRASRELD
jgi:hypothetical protein